MQLTSRCHGAAGAGRREARTVPGGPLPLGLIMACAVLSAGPSPAPAADRAAAPSRVAQQLFAGKCAECHGADGRGGPGRQGAGGSAGVALPEIPDFTDRAWQNSRSNVQLVVSVLEGKGQHMPANRGMVDDGLARDLVTIVRSFAPAPAPVVAKAAPAPPPAAAGPAGTPAAPTPTAAAPTYTPTGDFDADFDALAKQFEFYQRQMRELASAPVARNTTVASVPPPVAPPAPAPAAEPPPAPATAAAPEAAPRVSAPPANQVVYLAEKRPAATDKPPAADTSPQPLQLLLTGLGGAVLGLAVLSALWGAFTRRRTPAALNDRPAPTLSSGRPDVAPASMDCVGAGL